MRVFGAPLDALCERTGVDVAPFRSIPETLHVLASELALHANSDSILNKFPPAEEVYGLVHSLDRGGPYLHFEDAAELWVRIILILTKTLSNAKIRTIPIYSNGFILHFYRTISKDSKKSTTEKFYVIT